MQSVTFNYLVIFAVHWNPTKWHIIMALTTILLIFGIYHASGSQVTCANCEYSILKGQSVRSHHNLA